MSSRSSTPRNSRAAGSARQRGPAYTTHAFGASIVINGDYYAEPGAELYPNMTFIQAGFLRRNAPPSAPGVLQPVEVSSQDTTHPTLSHAAVGKKMDFHDKWGNFRPYLIELAGLQPDPWAMDDEVVLQAWSAIWGGEDAGMHRIRIIQYAKSELDVWRLDLAQYALEYLKRSWDEETSTVEARKNWIGNVMTPLGSCEDDIVLYYKRVRGSAPDLRGTGLFKSPIIASTLAMHLLLVSEVPLEKRCAIFPQAALMLAIHSATRAVKMWASGERPTDPHADFNDIPSNKDFIIEKVTAFLLSDAAKVQDVFDCALQQIQVSPDSVGQGAQ